jgi:hypothetical protein
MFSVFFVFLWMITLPGIFLFGFLLGRCARKLPIVDDTLPWTLHWGETIPQCEEQTLACGQLSGPSHWPRDRYRNNAANGHHSQDTRPCGLGNCPVQ